MSGTGRRNLGALCRAPSETFLENEKMMKIVTDSCQADPDREYDHAKVRKGSADLD